MPLILPETEVCMGIGITPSDDKGVCSVCGKKTDVRRVIDEEKGVGFGICEACADKSPLTVDECMEKYGKKLK